MPTDNPKHRPAFQPRAGSIKDAVRYSGIGRSSLYLEAARHPGLFRKWNGANGRTIVDFDILDSIINALPVGPAKPMPRLPRRKMSQNSALPNSKGA
jgi:hypothetical protein